MDGERPSTRRGRPPPPITLAPLPTRLGGARQPPSIAEHDPAQLSPHTPSPLSRSHDHTPRPIRPHDGDDDADGIFAFARPPTSNTPPIHRYPPGVQRHEDDNGIFAFAPPASPQPAGSLPSSREGSSAGGSSGQRRPSTARPSTRSMGSMQFPLGLQRLDSTDTGTFAFASPTTSEAPHPLTPEGEAVSSCNSHRPLRPVRDEDGDIDNVFAFSNPSPPKEQQYPVDPSNETLAAYAPAYVRPGSSGVASAANPWAFGDAQPARIPSAVPEEVQAGTFAFASPEEAHIPSDRLTVGQPVPLPANSESTFGNGADSLSKRGTNVDIELGHPLASPTTTAYQHSTVREPLLEPNLNRSAFRSWRYEAPPDESGLRRRHVYPPPPAGSSGMKKIDEQASGDKLDQFNEPNDSRPVLLSRPKTAYTEYTERTERTERTEQTVPHGVTTWGDGMGGELNTSASPRSSFDEDSPYPEVRAAVSNLDDPDMPTLTFRVFFIGILMTVIRAALNTFFRLRPPAPYIAPTVVCFFAYPFGQLLAWILPIGEWTLPRWLGGFKFDLNPCSFNIKEHSLIVAMSDIGGNVCGVLVSIATMRRNYGLNHGAVFTILICVVTQATGSAFSFVLQKSAVASASLLWPEVLGTTTLLNTLHADSADGKGISRKRFFGLSAAAMFVYTPLPARLFSAMAFPDWPAWIAPHNITVNQLFGVATGLGMMPITLDYTQIMKMATPFYIPWLTALNLLVGWALFYCCLAPALYYTNTWFTGHMAMSSSRIADRFGMPYNVSRVLQGDTLDEAAYHAYSPVYFAAAYHATHLMAFGVATSVLTHFAVHHGAHFWRCLRRRGDEEPPDVHAKMMRAYRRIPGWWFGLTLLLCFVAGIVGLEVYETGMPVWGLVLGLVLGALFAIPATFMAGVTTFTPPTNVIYELVAGFLWPGRPVPLLLFKALGIQTVSATVNFTRGLKLGHYMKVPPRDIFLVQALGLVLCCLVNAGMYAWVPSCDTCTFTTADYSASVIWGVIGPRRLFAAGAPYARQLWVLLVGALLPPALYWARRHAAAPRLGPLLAALGAVNVPLMLSSAYFWPTVSFMHVATFAALVFAANYYARRRHTRWWIKYNYVLGAGLGVGCVLAQILCYLVFDVREITLSWWGNDVWKNTADYNGTAVSRTAPPGGFGPANFP